MLFCSLVALALSAPVPSREFIFEYSVKVPAQTAPTDIYLPIATSNETQRIVSRQVDIDVDAASEVERKYGNRYWHARVPTGEAANITIRYHVRRALAGPVKTVLSTKERDLYLQANERVPVTGDLIDRVLKDVRPPKEDTASAWARAIYEYVVTTMEYKKVGSGWGNGDTYWACSQRYGNCTDFHALFISLARRKGIPARFEVGFPVPQDRAAGEIGGYHCWVSFYDGEAWVPIDASEAKKHPQQRDELFGGQPADRIFFTQGRDLLLGQHSGPLNYFVYPLVEVAGRVLAKSEMALRFSFAAP